MRASLAIGLILTTCLGCRGQDSAASPDKSALAPRAGAPHVPAVTHVLSAENTMGFAAFENLDGLGAEVERMLAALPPSATEDAPPAIRDSAARRSLLGFDPTRADGWAAVGVDATAGGAVVFDRRLGGRPLLVVRVVDEEKLRAALARADVVIGALTTAGPLRQATVQGGVALIGQRAGWTFVVPAADPAKHSAALAAVVAEDTPLSGHADLRSTFSDGVAPLWLSAWISSATTAAFWRSEGGQAAQVGVADFYAARFPAVGFALGKGNGALRALASPVGLASLKKLFQPPSAPPALSTNLNESMALRFDINFGQLFDGLRELIPPDQAEPLQQLSLAQVGLPQVVGFTFDEAAAALTGHGLVQRPLPKPGQAPGLGAVALGVADEKKADELVDRVVKLLANRSGTPATAVPVGAHTAQVLGLGPLQVGIVRVEKVLWIGEIGALKAGIAGAAHPPALVARIDQPAVFALFVHLEALPGLLDGRPEDRAVLEAGLALWKADLTDGWLISSLRLDDRGLVLGEGPAGAALPGVVAAIAIPAFLKYIRRAKTSEATLNLMRLTRAVSAYHTEHGALPPSAPLTPPESACRDGEATPHPPNPTVWGPPWQALGFQPDTQFLFQYEYISDGQRFTARAFGDLDCDGTRSTFERVGEIDEAGGVRLSPSLSTHRDLE